MSEAEQQVAAAVSARAAAELASLQADTDARRSVLRGDSAQTGLADFFRKGSSSESLVSSENLFLTPVKKKRGRPAFGSQTPDQLLAAERRLEYREAERKVAEAKAQLAALKREALAEDEKQVLPSPTTPTAKRRPGRPRKEASGETQLVFSTKSTHGRQRGRHIKSATPLPKEKLAIQLAVDAAESQLPPGTMLPSAFWEELSKQTGDVDAFFLRRYCSPEERGRVAAYLASSSKARSKRGAKRYWQKHCSQAAGRRLTADGQVAKTNTDWCLPVWRQTKAWAAKEGMDGHELGPDDLLLDFEDRLLDHIYEMEQAKAAGSLSAEEEKRLAQYQKRRDFNEKESCRKSYRAKLLAVCELVDRKPGNLSTYSPEENSLICELTWQSFDFLIQLLKYGSEEDLMPIIADALLWIKNREQTVIHARDAVPVYLDAGVGRILIPASEMDKRNQRDRARAKGVKGSDLPQTSRSKAVDCQGSGRSEKDRLTWVQRSSLWNYFREHKEDSLPQGKIDESILIVPCAWHCRLEDISTAARASDEVWTRSHSFIYNGETVVRKKGEKVGNNLMKSHRDLRREEPGLYRKGVRVWGQPQAYEDEIIVFWLSELDSESSVQSVCQVDMFAGEMTENVQAINFARQQAKHIIGPKQTAKLQVTDVKFAKLGKDAAQKVKIRLRRLNRKAAQHIGEAAAQKANAYTSLTTLIAMHEATVKANSENDAVLKAFREGGFLAYECGPFGLVPASGAKWDNYPLCSSRIDKESSDKRMSWMTNGVVSKADWHSLSALRKKLRQQAEDRRVAEREAQIALDGRGGKKVRHHICSQRSWLKRNRERQAAKAAAEGQEEEEEAAVSPAAKKVKLTKVEPEPAEAAPAPAGLVLLHPEAAKAEDCARAAEAAEEECEELTCFNDLLDGAGQTLFEEATEDAFHLSAVTLQSLEDGDNAAFNALHPRKRRQLLDEAQMHFLPGAKKSRASRSAEKANIRQLSRQQSRKKSMARYQQLVLEVGREEAAKTIVPCVEKKKRKHKKKDEKLKAKVKAGEPVKHSFAKKLLKKAMKKSAKDKATGRKSQRHRDRSRWALVTMERKLGAAKNQLEKMKDEQAAAAASAVAALKSGASSTAAEEAAAKLREVKRLECVRQALAESALRQQALLEQVQREAKKLEDTEKHLLTAGAAKRKAAAALAKRANLAAETAKNQCLEVVAATLAAAAAVAGASEALPPVPAPKEPPPAEPAAEAAEEPAAEAAAATEPAAEAAAAAAAAEPAAEAAEEPAGAPAAEAAAAAAPAAEAAAAAAAAEPAAEAAAEAAEALVGKLVRVNVDTLGPAYFGDHGVVKQVSQSAGSLTYSSSRKIHKGALRFTQLLEPKEDHIVPIDAVCLIEKKPMQAATERKSLMHLHKDVKLAWQMREDDKPYELQNHELHLHSELDQAEVEAGAFELFWRLAPPPGVFSLSATFVEQVLAILAPAKGETVPPNFFAEMQPSLTRFWQYLTKGVLILLPIIVDGHWTLLVFQRLNGTEKEKEKSSGSSSASPTAPLMVAGCAKCRGKATGCLDCSPDKMLQHGERRGREMTIADPLKYCSDLPECNEWSVRYYDSLPKEKAECKKKAESLVRCASAVGVPEMQLERSNSCFQKAADCGFWTLHFMEEEVRWFLGEGRWSKPYDWQGRLDRLKAVQKKLLEDA